MPNVLVIGAGLTGALCASSLKRQRPSWTITVVDKARGAGGRLSTTRSPSGVNKADLGAQYITTSDHLLKKHCDVYNTLAGGNLIEPLSATIEGMKKYPPSTSHFVAPQGMNSIVKRFLSDLPENSVMFEQQLSTVKKSEKFDLVFVNELNLTADVVISTMPVPQLLALKGVDDIISEDVKKKLAAVKYTSRYVLVYFYDGVVDLPNVTYGSKYLNDDIFRYVSIENIKRNSDEATSVVFHTSISFGAANASRKKEEMLDQLLAKAQELFPDWPAPSSTKCHKWLYSQVEKSYEGAPGCLIINKEPLFIVAGDGFTESTVNGCIESAKAAAAEVVKNYADS